MKYPKRTRRKYICYPPNYKPGDGYIIVYSKFQMMKTLKNFGIGAEAVREYLTRDRWIDEKGIIWRSIGFWNSDYEWEML